jgi:hypothetical protein
MQWNIYKSLSLQSTMHIMKTFRGLWLVLAALLGLVQIVLAANDVPTQFTNMGGIINTRHNMSQSTEQSNSGGTMNPFRNRYGEVCVYCHTPHGANVAAAVPLWNRSLPTNTTYITYDKLNTSTLTQAVYQPGAASLPCLSCHDGSQAIDAIINMPGSGQYSATADPTTWQPSGPGQFKSGQHRTMTACMACHASDGGPAGLGLGVATDFASFVIGTDLQNDHPIGVVFPTANGNGTDWKTPSGTLTRGSMVANFFDENPTNGRMDKSEIRLYDSGHGASVECASCHDPHGVPSAGAGSKILPTFLRKSNADSAVCLTCHTK